MLCSIFPSSTISHRDPCETQPVPEHSRAAPCVQSSPSCPGWACQEHALVAPRILVRDTSALPLSVGWPWGTGKPRDITQQQGMNSSPAIPAQLDSRMPLAFVPWSPPHCGTEGMMPFPSQEISLWFYGQDHILKYQALYSKSLSIHES